MQGARRLVLGAPGLAGRAASTSASSRGSRKRRYRLELSHWSGPVAQLELYQGWVYAHRYNALFGKYTYRGVPVHGFGTTRYGVPTDSYGRLLYLDTFDSVYGLRVGGGRTRSSRHKPSGASCYGFYD